MAWILQEELKYGFKQGYNMTVTALEVGGDASVHYHMDMVSVWSFTRPISTMAGDFSTYALAHRPGLRMLLPLDDGKGDTSLVYKFEEDGTSSTTSATVSTPVRFPIFTSHMPCVGLRSFDSDANP